MNGLGEKPETSNEPIFAIQTNNQNMFVVNVSLMNPLW